MLLELTLKVENENIVTASKGDYRHTKKTSLSNYKVYNFAQNLKT